jgi:hypothetical protein
LHINLSRKLFSYFDIKYLLSGDRAPILNRRNSVLPGPTCRERFVDSGLLPGSVLINALERSRCGGGRIRVFLSRRFLRLPQ